MGGAGCGACGRGSQPRTRAVPGLRPRLLKGLCQELADRRFPFRREAREAKRGPASEGERCSRQVPDGASLSGAARREAAASQQIVCADCVNLSAARSIKERPCASRRAVSPHRFTRAAREDEGAWVFAISLFEI